MRDGQRWGAVGARSRGRPLLPSGFCVSVHRDDRACRGFVCLLAPALIAFLPRLCVCRYFDTGVRISNGTLGWT